jgi:outer membrane protein assembly factor BamA
MKIKKNILMVLTIFIIFLPSIIRANDKGLFADFSINSFSNADTSFKESYQSSIIVPEVTLGYFLLDNLYVFGSFESYNVDGKTQQWNFALNMNQKIYSFGVGYYKSISNKLGLSGEIGAVSINYTEKLLNLELENKGSCTGFRLATKLQYNINNLIGFYLNLGYTKIKDTIDGIDNNFGGIRYGLGVKFFF